MKILLLLISIILFSCATRKYNYTFEMKYPIESKQLYYENDTFSIAMDMKQKMIGFKLYNKLNDGIKISWDEISISLNGNAYRVVHKETGTMKTTEVQPPTTIPPKAYLEDGLIPTKSISQVSGAFTNYKPITIIGDIFPVYDYGNKSVREKVMKLKGTKITIFLPYYISGKYVSQYYDLYVNDIVSKK